MAFFSKIFRSSAKKNLDGQKPAPDGSGATDEKRAPAAEPGAVSNAKAVRIFGVLRGPRLTEKSAAAAGQNEYAFVVSPRVNKIEVRRAAEERYGVHVERVRTVVLPAKKYARGRITGWRPGIKKAMVTVREGEKIEIQ